MEVIGRNGIRYDATHLSGYLWIVGAYIVLVRDGICQETICRATKANIAKLKARERAVGYCH